ncbi:related to extracellular serine-rich protein [Phialocephala subalpina]|uniref:Related to extracellular serine-rich protein n=1 Tax=Phialocephala subalpina TaxID=576137 RepID=A0A1L7WUY6_9HELO|nr:related to extracellular serine-rich protein [Phialocephala subalpina]
MFSKVLFLVGVLAIFLPNVIAIPAAKAVASEVVGTNQQTAVRQAAPVVATKSAIINGLTVSTNTTTAANITTPVAHVSADTVSSTILIFARDSASAYSAYSGLNAYAIPYQVVIVPQAGIALPVLNSTATTANYGVIVVLSEVSYDYGGTLGFQSALNASQWATLYQYQASFGVRMVRLDVFPSATSGTTSLGGCCDDGVEQYVNITSTAESPTSGLKTGAGISALGFWHYPASITNATIATEFAQFAPTNGFAKASTAGVTNKIDGRQQMVFFTSFATDWSATSNFLQHAWIHWATRGLYTGYRRATLNTQVDDMFLESDIYSPNGTTYQITPADLAQHVTWMATVNSRMPEGSDWFIEVGHNGNGNIEDAEDVDDGNTCDPGSIEYADQIDTPLEFAKPIGTGTSLWPSSPAAYPYTTSCTNLDALKVWWAEPANLNAFAHVSHTFTHEDQDNATYFDCTREISWNQVWLTQVGIAAADRFSPKGIIPPAITGLHNGDALRAWLDNGIVNVVNEMWPLISTVAENGYAGVQINPRWATNIYYNCQLPPCTVLEWINTSAGDGDWYTLLELEKQTNTRHLLGLHHDAFMFHQANLNYLTAPETDINGVSAKFSLFQAWVETVVQEMIRLVDWPIVSQKHDDMAAGFASRMARDGCSPQLAFKTNPTKQTITGITLTTTKNNCTALIPVTVPGNVTDTKGFTTEQLGSDPLTIWVKMSGSPVTFTLSEPIPL